MSILRGVFSEEEILARFDSVTLRMIRDRARAKGLGHRIGPGRYFTEDEILAAFQGAVRRGWLIRSLQL